MNRFKNLGLWLIAILLVGIPISSAFLHFLTETWWFQAVGYGAVFWTSFSWEGGLGCLTFLGYGLVLWGHYRWAQAQTRGLKYRIFELSDIEPYSEQIVQNSARVGILLIALIGALSAASDWNLVLQFFHAKSFNQIDPIFGKDIGFYLFRLPFWDILRQWLLMLMVWSLVIVASIYSLKGVFTLPFQSIRQGIKLHLGLILGGGILLSGWGWRLHQFHLLNHFNGVVYGMGYTDANARVFGIGLLSVLSIVGAIAVLITLFSRSMKPFLGAMTIFVLAYGLFWGIVPWGMQQLIVKPNELVKEKPFIAHNIQGTLAAYQLSTVEQQNYNVRPNLTLQGLEKNKTTLQNVRLWDYRPLLKTYRQLQEIRSYYKFHDVDVDRYQWNGDPQQVMLSARELEPGQLPAQAQNWVNQQLKYTHGHGLVMSPVNAVGEDGLPQFFIQDIPPKSTLKQPIQQPAIYYGELTRNYVFTGTTTDEFDFPQGGTNAANRYDGIGGVAIQGWGQKIAYAMDFGNLQILISNYFGPTTKIHYHRQIRERVQHIAPFLRYDRDPYLVLANGRLQWILDAYTVSDRYPYSEPVNAQLNLNDPQKSNSASSLVSGNINYIRNSVKVVIDAYDGNVDYYVVDPNDPIVATYQSIFPQLFKTQAQIPSNLQSHFRYPQDLFQIQTSLYLTYHMTDPEVYYNREDLWQLPTQIYEDQAIKMEPYYVIMRLPGEEKPEFALIQPFTPNQKDNMIAWMAARCDGAHYGKLLQFDFPKQSLVFGPRQIEARIDQTPTISQQFTLWSQSGSKVLRGNLIVLPIEESLLYVEPVYLRAEQAELPELKRVIVAYDKSVVMAENFDAALAQIFGTPPKTASEAVSEAVSQPLAAKDENLSQLSQDALKAHESAEQAARQGKWSEFGTYQQRLKQLLKQLTERTQVH